MEDTEDGRKISIQDGVEEDPTIIPMGRGVSGVGKTFIAQPMGSPIITSIFDIHTAIGCPSCPIVSILETAVT